MIKWRNKPVTWNIKDIGGSLLDSIARGTYEGAAVLREYVQNAVDSYVDFRKETGFAPDNTVQIWIDPENNALQIMDNGMGMNESDIFEAKKIAVSPKPGHAEFAGFRGIGIWSGLPACEELVVITTRVNDPHIYKLTIDCKGIVEHLFDGISIDELLDGRFRIDEDDWEPSEHFTQVKLSGVSRNLPGYGVLLEADKIRVYAEQNLPVPFDPTWDDEKGGYAQYVERRLREEHAARNYAITINGDPVYRRFPPINVIKPPEVEVIRDEAGRAVAVGWVCETARADPGAKRLSPKRNETWVRSLGVRVRNFAVGPRGLYSNEGVTDPTNLNWFVGEVYIIDPDIKPNTKRDEFQASERKDTVVRALRNYYTATSLRARGLSAQLAALDDCEEAKGLIDQVTMLLDDSTMSSDEKKVRLEVSLPSVHKVLSSLESARAEADKEDKSDDAVSTRIRRRYLRKITDDIDTAIGGIKALQTRLQKEAPDIPSSLPETKHQKANGRRNRRSTARTATLKGKPLTPSDLLGLQTAFDDTGNMGYAVLGAGTQARVVDISTIIQAVGAAVAAIVGEESETFRRIMERVPVELARRGMNV